MQNIFIVPAMQHGCRAKPLLSLLFQGNYLKQPLVGGEALRDDSNNGCGGDYKNEGSCEKLKVESKSLYRNW